MQESIINHKYRYRNVQECFYLGGLQSITEEGNTFSGDSVHTPRNMLTGSACTEPESEPGSESQCLSSSGSILTLALKLMHK
jgi:hypothetical protein